MKTIYCIEAMDSDPSCGNRSVQVLHTTNKAYLEDLVYKLKRINEGEYQPSLYIKTIIPKQSLTKEDIVEGKNSLEAFGVNMCK